MSILPSRPPRRNYAQGPACCLDCGIRLPPDAPAWQRHCDKCLAYHRLAVAVCRFTRECT